MTIAENDIEEVCVICLETKHVPLKTLECGHQFHEECIDDWLEYSKDRTCPVCRAICVYSVDSPAQSEVLNELAINKFVHKIQFISIVAFIDIIVSFFGVLNNLTYLSVIDCIFAIYGYCGTKLLNKKYLTIYGIFRFCTFIWYAYAIVYGHTLYVMYNHTESQEQLILVIQYFICAFYGYIVYLIAHIVRNVNTFIQELQSLIH